MVLDGFNLIKQGAEARLYKGEFMGRKAVIKERFQKKYRHPQLDSTLNKERVKAEGRALYRCKALGVTTPTVYFVDIKRGLIIMEEIEGETTKDAINRLQKEKNDKELTSLTKDIGEAIGKLHADNLIHGDLTTSNMIVRDNCNDRVVMIDFGLSHMSSSTEDKAVDLYVLERAIISTHPDSEQLIKSIFDSYKQTYSNGSQQVMTKFDEVRARGRKRTMVG